MPREYENIRDSYLDRGESEKEAKRKAAMTYVKHHGRKGAKELARHRKAKHRKGGRRGR